MRDQLAQKIGAPEGQAVSAQGFRVYFWAQRTIMLTMDARSVQLTVFGPKPRDEASDDADAGDE